MNSPALIDLTKISRMCKACLKVDDHLTKHLFELTSNGTSLSEMFKICTNIRIQSGETTLPHSLCVGCIEDMKIAYSFIMKSKKNDLLLKNLIAEYEDDDDDHEEVIDIGNNGSYSDCLSEDSCGTAKGLKLEANKNNLITKKSCTHCSLEFTKDDDLKRHISDKHVEKPLATKLSMPGLLCKYCSLEFNEDNDLKKHIADNHIEGAISPRPYLLCKYCSKEFDKSVDLKKHLLLNHFDVMQHQPEPNPNGPPKLVPIPRLSITCKQCNKEFKEDVHFQRHVLLEHNSSNKDIPKVVASKNNPPGLQLKPKTSTICKFCKKNFYESKLLKWHLNKMHRAELKIKKLCETIIIKDDQGEKTTETLTEKPDGVGTTKENIDAVSESTENTKGDECINKTDDQVDKTGDQLDKTDDKVDKTDKQEDKTDKQEDKTNDQVDKTDDQVNKTDNQVETSQKNDDSEENQQAEPKKLVELEEDAANQIPLLICKFCEKEYKEDLDLMQHIVKEHKDRTFRSSQPAPKVEVTPLKFTFKLETGVLEPITRDEKPVPVENLNLPPLPLLICKYCEQEFQEDDVFKRHVLQQHGPCQFCGKSCTLLSAHYSSCTKCVECKRCKKTYTTPAYKKHVDTCMRQCKICGKVCKSPQKMRAHQLWHTKPYQCDVCGRNFSSKALLRMHHTTHGKPTVPCDVCGKKFSNASYVKLHKKIHQRDYLKCNYCDSKFLTEKRMESHICLQKMSLEIQGIPIKDDNAEEKELKGDRFPCEFCDKFYLHKATLKAHVARVHMGRIFKCKYCDKEFNERYRLEDHENKHTGQNQYKCDECDKVFVCKKPYMRHRWTHKRPLYSCQFCDKTFPFNDGLKQHMFSHMKGFLCSECGRVFSRANSLREHMNKHNGVKPFKCDVCDREFYTKSAVYVHKKLHDKGIKLNCDICSVTFKYRWQRTKHMKRHLDDGVKMKRKRRGTKKQPCKTEG